LSENKIKGTSKIIAELQLNNAKKIAKAEGILFSPILKKYIIYKILIKKIKEVNFNTRDQTSLEIKSFSFKIDAGFTIATHVDKIIN
jgi:hypothetical protein